MRFSTMTDFSCFWISCTVATSYRKIILWLHYICWTLDRKRLFASAMDFNLVPRALVLLDKSAGVWWRGNLVLRVFDPGNGNEVGRRVKKLRTGLCFGYINLWKDSAKWQQVLFVKKRIYPFLTQVSLYIYFLFSIQRWRASFLFRACTCETRVAFGAIFDQLLFPVITSRNAVFIEKILQNYN